jgi:methionine synthase II (cobalamin-independent)
MNRNKLIALGVNLPVLPTTSVGSLPKPEQLMTARKDFSQGKIGYELLQALEREATEFWVRKQDEVGLDVIVDGEMSAEIWQPILPRRCRGSKRENWYVPTATAITVNL